MDGLSLLERAQQVGLTVRVEGDRLVIRGPKRAEPVALMLIERKPEVLAELGSREPSDTAPNVDPAIWRAQYAARTLHWFLNGQRPWHQAQQVAFGELMLKWHRRYGAPPDLERCAGCGEHLPPEAGFVVDVNGTRVHFDGVRRLECVIAYGARWREAATRGLIAVGLEPPREMDAA